MREDDARCGQRVLQGVQPENKGQQMLFTAGTSNHLYPEHKKHCVTKQIQGIPHTSRMIRTLH